MAKQGIFGLIEAAWFIFALLGLTDVLLRLSDYHQLPIRAVHAPSLLLTQRVWGREPWEKLRRAKELAERVSAKVVVLHQPFRWQQKYVPFTLIAISRSNSSSVVSASSL